MDIAVVGAGVSLALDAGGVVTEAHVALGAVAPTALLVAEAGAALVGGKLDDAALDALDAAARAACNPIDDKRGTVDYRTKIAGVLARRVRRDRLRQGGGPLNEQDPRHRHGQRRPRRVPRPIPGPPCSTRCATSSA